MSSASTHAGTTDAVILVGGKGTRLRPLTVDTPKPMLPVAGFPFLEHLLARIKEVGITHVVLGTSFKPEVFQEYFGDGSDMGLEIEYVVEDQPLGTGGGMRNVLPKLRTDNAMIFNGDVLGGTDLGEILDTHYDNDADVTLHLLRVDDPRAFGCVPTSSEGRVQAFLEKTEDPPTDQINAGIYVFKKEIIEQIPDNRPVSVEREVFPKLLEQNKKVFGHVDQSYWRDMGTPMDFVRGSSDLVRGIAPSPLIGKNTGDARIDSEATVSSSALVFGGSVVGAGSVIKDKARVESSVIFTDVVIEEGAFVEDCVIASGAHIGAKASLKGVVVGSHAQVGERIELISGARVWPNIVLEDGAVRFSSDV